MTTVKMNSLLEAVRAAILSSPFLAARLKAVYDTMGEEERPPLGHHQYPYAAIWLSGLPDASDWAGDNSYFEFGVAIFDNRSDATELGLLGDALFEALSGVALRDVSGVYEDFTPEEQTAARVKESPEVWSMIMEFRAFVTLK